MPNCVVRFGGNNIKDSQAIQSLVNILKSTSENHIIVVSSISEVQDILTKSLELLKLGRLKSEEIINQLKNVIDHKYFSTGNELINKEFTQLETLLKGIEYTGDFSLALQDVVISFSERVTTTLLQQVLAENELASTISLPEEFGLKATSEFGNASALIEESKKSINQFSWSKINLIPGSYGLTEDNKIARLGKRAADYTASALTLIFGLDALELWQIGRPFKTANDEIVENAEYIESLTYQEASELSYFNQSSVHPRIVEPLIDKHIPIKVFELKDGVKNLKTTINSKSIIAEEVVKSVAHSDDIAILKLNGPGVGFKPGILSNVTTAFSQHQINIRSVITAQTSINIIIDKSSVKEAQKIVDQIELPSVSNFSIEEKISLIAIVGHGMQAHHGISAKLFTAVANNKINVLLSGSGASDLVSYLIVDEKDKVKAIQEIHKIFF